jgi:hypothetical protein
LYYITCDDADLAGRPGRFARAGGTLGGELLGRRLLPAVRIRGRHLSVSQSRRSGRRFLHVRIDVDDIRRLGAAPPFQWSRYEFRRQDDLYLYLQTLGASARTDVGKVGWKGDELVAFRLHLPSKIAYHNAGPANFKRGNILLWEQPLSARLRGDALVLDARMQTQSILYRTLLLFGGTFLAVAATFVVVVALVFRGGKKKRLEV